GGINRHPAFASCAQKGWNGTDKPYANGGFITKPPTALMGQAGSAVIIPWSANRRTRATEWLNQTRRIIRNDKKNVINEDGNGTREHLALLQQQVDLLRSILLKDQNTYVDGKALFEVNKEQEQKQQNKNNLARGI